MLKILNVLFIIGFISCAKKPIKTSRFEGNKKEFYLSSLEEVKKRFKRGRFLASKKTEIDSSLINQTAKKLKRLVEKEKISVSAIDEASKFYFVKFIMKDYYPDLEEKKFAEQMFDYTFKFGGAILKNLILMTNCNKNLKNTDAFFKCFENGMKTRKKPSEKMKIAGMKFYKLHFKLISEMKEKLFIFEKTRGLSAHHYNDFLLRGLNTVFTIPEERVPTARFIISNSGMAMTIVEETNCEKNKKLAFSEVSIKSKVIEETLICIKESLKKLSVEKQKLHAMLAKYTFNKIFQDMLKKGFQKKLTEKK